MDVNKWIAAITIGVIVLLVGGLLWWFVLRPEPRTRLEREEDEQTWTHTAGGDRCLDCGEYITWRDGGDEWIGHCLCCADDHDFTHEDVLAAAPDVERWLDEDWADELHRMNAEVLEFPPLHEHRELVPSSLYADLSDDPDLNRWDLEQQRGRIADIRTQLAMLGAREATWYADRLASVGERLAA